jgi:protocatechuate 3,4-dioxygenase beta subunit
MTKSVPAEARDPQRRQVVFLIGAAALGALRCGGNGEASSDSLASPSTTSSPSPATTGCVVKPQLTEGPYFVDEGLNRADIRTDPTSGTARPGTPLRIAFQVSRSSGGTCSALAGAQVDVWHCDALGTYSDVRDGGFNTVGLKYLRGYQVTDASGLASFTTIYPGWYSGRAVHVHFKIRTSPAASSGYEFTSQLFFDEALTDAVHAQSPYSQKGRRNTLNASDGIYRGGGSQLVLPTAAEGSGYGAAFALALQF